MITWVFTLFGFMKNNSTIIYIIAAGILGLFLFYKVNSYILEKKEIEEERNRIRIELMETKNKLLDSIKVANDNAKLLEEEKLSNLKTQEEMKIKHEEDMSKKQFFTIIKEKIKYEKDSDYISPVLRNTIDRLYFKPTK